MTYPTMPARPKRWFQRWWVWVVVGFIVLVVLPIGACTAIVGGVLAIGASAPDPSSSAAPVDSPEPEPSIVQPSAAPTPSASPSVEPEPTAAVEPLAESVWAEIVAGYGGTVPSSSPLFAVTSVEDVSGGTIRVFVQQDLSELDREEIARQVFNLGAFNNTALQTVVVQGADGRDSNHYRSDFPYLPQ